MSSLVKHLSGGALIRFSRALNRWHELSVRTGARNLLPAGIRASLRTGLMTLTRSAQIVSRVDPHTVLLADFPRCGMGWIRFTVATVLHYQRTGEFRKLTHPEMYRYVPTQTGSEARFRPYYFHGRENLLKTHQAFHPCFKRAVVIYRNPFDAIRSMYAVDHLEGKGNPYRRIGSWSADESYLIGRVRQYLQFHESWLPPIRSAPDRYLVIKYEEMLDSPTPALLRVCEFLNMDLSRLPPSDRMSLGTFYHRTESSPITMKPVSVEEALHLKQEVFARIQPVMAVERLRRLDRVLEARLQDVVRRMDAVRWRVPACAEMEESHA